MHGAEFKLYVYWVKVKNNLAVVLALFRMNEYDIIPKYSPYIQKYCQEIFDPVAMVTCIYATFLNV